MKILFVGDASNYHHSLSKALKTLGHETLLVSSGSGSMNTSRDIDLIREFSFKGRLKYLFQLIKLLPKFRGYDIVQISCSSYVSLRPRWQKLIFKYLKANNKKIFYSALGTDYFYAKACLDSNIFKYSDYRIGDKPSPHSISKPNEEKNWTTPEMYQYNKYLIDNVNGVMACLYEYYRTYLEIVPNKLGSCGIPIDMTESEFRPILNEPTKVRFLIGIQSKRSTLKGTDVMLEKLEQVAKKYPDKCEICAVSDLPYKEYITAMRSCHVLIDQLYSYTPATNALLAMAQGMVVVSGAEPEFYDYIGERENKPIINVSPIIKNDIEEKFEWIINNKHLLPELSQKSFDFVKKYNDSLVVAQQHLLFWQNH